MKRANHDWWFPEGMTLEEAPYRGGLRRHPRHPEQDDEPGDKTVYAYLHDRYISLVATAYYYRATFFLDPDSIQIDFLKDREYHFKFSKLRLANQRRVLDALEKSLENS